MLFRSQDAVAAANRLAAPLREGRLTLADLAAVESRRRWPTQAVQAMQIAMQNRVIGPALQGAGPMRPPLLFRALAKSRLLRQLAGRALGFGVRAEHVATGAVK